MTFVLDASIAVKWFFTNEKLHQESINQLNILILDPTNFAVPELFYLEVAAVIARKSSNNELFTRKAIESIYNLGIPTVPIQGKLLLDSTKIACSNKISVYDSIYLETSILLNAKWLTADYAAAKKIVKNSKLKKYIELIG